MLKVTFKNVGQGDSIILEWDDHEKRKIGIIDCNLMDNQNPVLSHLKQSEYTEIDFIILSHPHFDHFSGFNQLLDYCRSQKIVIQKFLHTSSQVPDYLKVANKTVQAQREIVALFKNIRQLWKTDKIIIEQGYINNLTRDIRLNDDTFLKILAPSTREFDSYISNLKVENDEESHHDNANANWLSTFLKIYSSDWQILLTSDCEKRVLNRWKNNNAEFSNQKLLLAQSPHHGARGNHSTSFWKQFSPEKDTPVIMSVGENIYKHPSKQNIDYFNVQGFKVYTTQTGEVFSEKAQQNSRLLDILSKKVTLNKTKDIIVEIDKSGIKIT